MAYKCASNDTIEPVRCRDYRIGGYWCDCPVVEADAKSPHKASDDTAILAAEKRKLDGQRVAIRRSLEQALERPTHAALQRHFDGLRGYQESVIMELIDRAGALG